MIRIAVLALLLTIGGTAIDAAATPPLPQPDEVFSIAVKPQAKQHPVFFTPERLLASLPRFKPAYMLPPLGGKIWSQSGVIVLKDQRVLFWKSFRPDVIAVETAGEPIIYVLGP